jgi:uncharacterized protein YjbJ (UPF0337 family)
MNTNETKKNVKSAVNGAVHSGTTDQAKGHTKEVIGAVKEKVGHLIGDRDLEGQGKAQNAEGKKDRIKGEIKESIEDVEARVKAGIEVVKDKLHGR